MPVSNERADLNAKRDLFESELMELDVRSQYLHSRLRAVVDALAELDKIETLNRLYK
jgi:hypothetical protein